MSRRVVSWRLLLALCALVALALTLVLAFAGRELDRLADAADAARVTSAMNRLAFSATIIGALLVAALAYVQTRRWRRMLRRVTHAAHGLASGDLTVRAEGDEAEELEPLARAINETRERLAEHGETIDAQRRTLESLLTQLREGVILFDSDGRVAVANDAAVRMLGMEHHTEPADLVGLAVERVIPLLDLQRLLLAEMPVRPTELSEAAPIGSARVQVETARGALHLLAHVSEFTLPAAQDDDSQRAAGRLLVLTDISELARHIQMKSDFVANASHELRTPLSTIRAAVETLQSIDLSADSHAAQRFVDVIDRQSARLEALAADLLELSRLESSAATFRTRAVPLAELLAEIEAHFAERIRAKRLRFALDAAAVHSTNILVSPQLLRLVLDNLLDNAVKFTEPGRAVELRVASLPQGVEFTVRDEGCGIPLDEQPRVFERFYQAERARSGPERGTGLGLSIVRHAVGAMGGQVTLDSTPGVGTRVTVTIPQPAALAA